MQISTTFVSAVLSLGASSVFAAPLGYGGFGAGFGGPGKTGGLGTAGNLGNSTGALGNVGGLPIVGLSSDSNSACGVYSE